MNRRSSAGIDPILNKNVNNYYHIILSHKEKRNFDIAIHCNNYNIIVTLLESSYTICHSRRESLLKLSSFQSGLSFLGFNTNLFLLIHVLVYKIFSPVTFMVKFMNLIHNIVKEEVSILFCNLDGNSVSI